MTMANVQDQLQQALGTAYVIERELGGGGMSRVFVADEAALGRQVVVKVLGVELAEGISAERFKREVRLAARLQHPHIVPLLAAGALTDGLLYYTMPFVDGESLRARLAREGGFPIADAVRIGRDVASALAYAHRAGVVHRDIKPENILLADGGAVVVDFGIAKAIHESRGADDAPDSRRSSTLTRVGTSLGTPAYMAPEQAAGDAIDQRADLYALGVVVYEMIAGRALFERRTAQQTLAAHATEAPEPIARHRSALPPSLGALIMQLLEKNPADRPQSADEVLRGLDDAMRAHPESHSLLHAQAGAALSGATYESGGHTDSPSRPVRRSRIGLLMFVGAVAALAGAAAGALIMRSRPSAPRLLAAAITAPDGAVLKPGAGFALSPEGGRLAFVAADSVGAQAIWVQPLDGQLPAPVSGTENGTGPFWSPDGASLGFFAGGRLKIVELRGGSPRVLCAALRAGGGTWTKDGVIVYAPNIIVGSPLFRVASAGGPCTQLTRLRPSDGDHRRPSALPDGRHVLFSAFRAKVALAADVVTGAITEVRRPGGDAQFAAPDWLLFRDEERGVLYAQRLDLRTLRPVGESRVVLDRLGNPSLRLPGPPRGVASAPALAVNPGNRSEGLPRRSSTTRLSPSGRSVRRSRRCA